MPREKQGDSRFQFPRLSFLFLTRKQVDNYFAWKWCRFSEFTPRGSHLATFPVLLMILQIPHINSIMINYCSNKVPCLSVSQIIYCTNRYHVFLYARQCRINEVLCEQSTMSLEIDNLLCEQNTM
jgi:hypothetical protein